jgi:hypothetical protein
MSSVAIRFRDVIWAILVEDPPEVKPSAASPASAIVHRLFGKLSNLDKRLAFV